jgi:hypothetical protein
MGEYVPQAPINDEAKKYNQNLPGMGGVFNVVNLHVYHYAGNNPVKYTDPDGRENETFETLKQYIKDVIKIDTARKIKVTDNASAEKAASMINGVTNNAMANPELYTFFTALGVLGALISLDEDVKNLANSITDTMDSWKSAGFDVMGQNIVFDLGNNARFNTHFGGSMSGSNLSLTVDATMVLHFNWTNNVAVRFGVGVDVPFSNIGNTTFNNGGHNITILFTTRIPKRSRP